MLPSTVLALRNGILLPLSTHVWFICSILFGRENGWGIGILSGIWFILDTLDKCINYTCILLTGALLDALSILLNASVLLWSLSTQVEYIILMFNMPEIIIFNSIPITRCLTNVYRKMEKKVELSEISMIFVEKLL